MLLKIVTFLSLEVFMHRGCISSITALPKATPHQMVSWHLADLGWAWQRNLAVCHMSLFTFCDPWASRVLKVSAAA